MANSIAVASGKGGVGKTTIAVNLALTLKMMGQQVALLDTDFGLANSHILLGINPKKTVRELLKKNLSINEIIENGPLGLKFVSGGSGLIDIFNLEVNSIFQVIRAFEPLNKSVDTLVVDIPAGASDHSLSFSGATDRLLIVLVGEPTSFMDAYTFIKAASIEKGIRNFSVVVNMSESNESAEATFQRFHKIVDKFLDVNVSYAGTIPRSRKIQQAIVKKRPIVLDKSAELEILSFKRLAKNIIKSGVNRNNGIRFFS